MTLKTDERIRGRYAQTKPTRKLEHLEDLSRDDLSLIIEGLTEREMWGSGYELARMFEQYRDERFSQFAGLA